MTNDPGALITGFVDVRTLPFETRLDLALSSCVVLASEPATGRHLCVTNGRVKAGSRGRWVYVHAPGCEPAIVQRFRAGSVAEAVARANALR